VSALLNRLNIPDARGKRAYLQVTRHSDQRKVVLSQWRDGLCVASTPVDVAELPALIAMLAEALGDAATVPSDVSKQRAHRSFWDRARRYFRPTLGRIVELPHVHDRGQEEIG
jgi:hypothetical protein